MTTHYRPIRKMTDRELAKKLKGLYDMRDHIDLRIRKVLLEQGFRRGADL